MITLNSKTTAEQQALKTAGMRVTPQRLAILQMLSGTKAHPSPEAVYRELKSTYPGLSLNTVYQTLHSLEQAGLLRRISMEENVYRYDANTAPHAHLICRSCGRVDDTNGDIEPLMNDLLSKSAAKSPWDIRDLDCCFYGICPACRKAQGESRKSNEEV